MTEIGCPVCGEWLGEVDPGVDGLCNDDDDITRSFIVRNFMCNNDLCPLDGERLDVFFDYTRIDLDGDEIDIEELCKRYHGRQQER